MSEDISVADEATAETDLSVGETAPVEVTDDIEADPLPEDFDLAAWVEGLRPTRRAKGKYGRNVAGERGRPVPC